MGNDIILRNFVLEVEKMLDLSKLNKEQYEAVTTTEGPLLILAGAGSGKTRVLTYRIAYLIERGVSPYSILAITFTNKAADEMKERVMSLVGDKAQHMWISTFHSACVRILRNDIERLGYGKNFVIYDTSDQEKIIKQVLKELDLSEKVYPPKEMLGKIGSLKDQLIDPKEYLRMSNDFRSKKIAEIYSLYQRKLKINNALDFDDIIFKTIELFKNHEDVLKHYQKKFKYILVDEYQDTNRAQYELVNLLAKEHRNLCVVGDDDQCLIEGQRVLTENGFVEIENIKEGDRVLSAAGFGKTTFGIVNKIIKKEYDGVVVKVKTKGGKTIKATPNHITFAKINPSQGIYYVYLMYKRGKGYRIGQTQGVASRDGEIVNGLMVRINQEHADKVWILRICKDKTEASFFEQYFSIKYGIPTTVFNTIGRKIAMTQEQVDELYEKIDTHERAAKLMEENFIYEEYPHHIPNAVIRGNSVRRIINLTFFSEDRFYKEGYHGHRISLNTTGDELREKFKVKGFPVRNGKRETWRIETSRKEYDEAEDYVKSIQKEDSSFEVLRRARLTENEAFRFMPFAHLRPTMSIAVREGNKIVEDIIEEVEFEEYKGFVFDLSVEHLRQYVCSDVVVHNSIYGWRGADIRNILDFEKDFPEAKVVKLEQNYRCTKRILEAANYVIANNENRKAKRLWTQNKLGDNIKFFRAETDQEEARFIAYEVEKLLRDGYSHRDFAVLYRTNAMSRILEEAFVRQGIPYRVVGAFKFYDRKEIKDIISYLKFINNPQDTLSLERIINTPKRGIGDATLDKIRQVAERMSISFFDALNNLALVGISGRAESAIRKFTSLMNYFISIKNQIKVSELINEILEKTGYLEELQREGSPEADARIENLKELYSSAVEFEQTSEEKTLEAYLERISLVSDQDTIEGKTSVTLMTLHAAKGLEFPVVFIAGMEDGIFPHFSALEDDDEMEEERRLCYVGITRAKEILYLTCAKQRLIFGRTSFNPVSSFIDEIPEDLLEDLSRKTSKPSRFIYEDLKPKTQLAYTVDSKVKIEEPKKKNNIQVKLGDRVKHKIFGIGIVIAIKDSKGDLQVTVSFEKAGVKTLLLSTAPLEVV